MIKPSSGIRSNQVRNGFSCKSEYELSSWGKRLDIWRIRLSEYDALINWRKKSDEHKNWWPHQNSKWNRSLYYNLCWWMTRCWTCSIQISTFGFTSFFSFELLFFCWRHLDKLVYTYVWDTKRHQHKQSSITTMTWPMWSKPPNQRIKKSTRKKQMTKKNWIIST